MGNLRRLRAVDGAGTGQQEAPGPALTRQFQHAPCHPHVGVENPGGALLVRPKAPFGSRMHHERKSAVRKGEPGRVARVQRERRVFRQVWRAGAEARRIARQQDHGHAQPQPPVRPQQALRQPGSDETRASGKEQAFAPDLRPERARVLQNVVEILRQRVFHRQSHPAAEPSARGSA